jgi:peptidoglycan hydrolase-like protein with peptidoglycan-binding domain
LKHFRIVAILFLGLSIFGVSARSRAEPLRNWQTVTLGDHDVTVCALQALLVAHGYKVSMDGYFGQATQKALRQFQHAHQLLASGATNDPTWEALLVRLHQGSKGPGVRAAQIELRAAGYAVVTDGVFGAHMKSVVRRYQKQLGQTADGVIGRNTWYELLGGDETEGD